MEEKRYEKIVKNQLFPPKHPLSMKLDLVICTLRTDIKYSVFKIDWNCNFVGLLPKPRPMPITFYVLVGYDRVRNYTLWVKSVIILDQLPLFLRCIPDAYTLKSRFPRPTPVLPVDQSPICTTNPRPLHNASTLTTPNIIYDQPTIIMPYSLPVSNN